MKKPVLSLSESNTTIKLLLAATGSVASIKFLEIIQLLLTQTNVKFELKIILTKSAQHFIKPSQISEIYPQIPIYTDEMEWTSWQQRGDPVLHIELRKWANAMLITPLSANTLAKLSNGICDNLLTCVCRAWDINTAPLIVAPAMNTFMWDHPITAKQLKIIAEELQMYSIEPIEKKLACGDVGKGAMAEPTQIVQYILQQCIIRIE